MGPKRVMWVRRYQGQCRALRPLGHQGYRLRSHNKDQPLCSGYTIPPHNDPQLSLALPGVLEVRNNGIKGKYIVEKVLQRPLRKDRDAICVHGNW